MKSLQQVIFLVAFFVFTSSTSAGHVQLVRLEAEELPSTPPPPPRPYAFGYAAGRFPGHIDRTHSEISDGSGVVQGSYSYVDPRHQIRTVEYIADKDGFHSTSNHHVPDLPSDTPIVAAAKEKHLQKYAAIAEANQLAPSSHVVVPVDSAAVQYAKDKHFRLYQKIAEEHARMAAELEALRLAEEAKKAQEEEVAQHHQIV